MKEKSTRIIWKVLSLLSGLNLLLMGLCVIITQSLSISFLNNNFMAGLFPGPFVKILINHMMSSVGQMTWVFVIVNVLLSLVLLITALIIQYSKKTEFSTIRRSSAVFESR